MIQLEIYSDILSPRGIVTGIKNLRWRRKYFDVGEFELNCECNPNNLEILRANYIITRLDDEEVGIIENISIKESETDGEIITATGKFLKTLLDNRILLETEYLTGNVEQNIRYLVDKNLISPVDQKRRIFELKLGEIKNFTDTLDLQVGLGKNILTVIDKICRVTNLSTKITVDYDKEIYKFDVWEGRDLSDLVILSDSDGNIQNSEYEKINSAYRSYSLVAGQGEGVERKRISLDDGAMGWYRKEMYVDARDIQNKQTNSNNEEIILSDEEYNKLLETRGREKMADRIKFTNFSAETTQSVNDKYKVDWDLGDIVTVYKTEWGIEIQERITEVEETLENGIITVYPTFGSPVPELKDILKEELEG